MVDIYAAAKAASITPRGDAGRYAIITRTYPLSGSWSPGKSTSDASATRIHGHGRIAKCAMLNHNVASREFFSSFALNMRCAMYPPPPGSAPGYQVAHQFIEI